MLVFSQNGGSTSMVLSRQSQNPMVIQGRHGGTRLLTVTVLAIDAGDPAAPGNAILPRAGARLQLRFVVGVDENDILPALRMVQHEPRIADQHDGSGIARQRVSSPPAAQPSSRSASPKTVR